MATRWILLATSLLAARTYALDMWTHESCPPRFPSGVMEKMVQQATETGTLIQLALDMEENPYALEAFEQIFQFKYNSPGQYSAELKHFQEVLYGQGGVTKMVPSSDGGTAAWMASHSRIYCDGAEHWVEEGDDEEIGFINRAQDEDQWLYVDDANGMVIRGKLWAKNPAIRMGVPTAYVDKEEGHPEGRTTIEINDNYFEQNHRIDLWPDKLDLPKGFQDDKGNYFPGIMRSYQIGSSLLFHEMTHTVMPISLRTTDLARFWAGVRSLNDPPKAVRTAAAYQLLGMAVRLIGYGFRLDPQANGELLPIPATVKREADTVEPDFNSTEAEPAVLHSANSAVWFA